MPTGGVLVAAVGLPFLAALFAPGFAKRGWNAGAAIAWIPALLSAWLLTQFPNPDVNARIEWVPELGLHLDMRLDGLSWLFTLLIGFVGWAVFLYAGAYMKDDPRRGRFFSVLSAFMGAMLGIVLTDNLLALVLFWELTSITSFLLIGYDHERPEARRAAIQALLVTASGGLALLAGVVILGQISGTYTISHLPAARETIASNPLYVPAIALILLGALTKSAQVPFHIWLPNAMNAPTPVSAYLHSATMVQAGVYLVARLSPTLGGHPAWDQTLVWVGCASAVVGSLLVLFQTDLKRLLAYSTIASLGVLIASVGLQASEAFLMFFVAHGLYKGGMFLIAGILGHATGTLDAREMGGLRRAMPKTATIALLLAASLAALPPMAGFVAKEMLLHSNHLPFQLAVMAYGASAVVAAWVVGIRPFWFGHGAHGHEASGPMLAGPAAMAVLSLFLGAAPALLTKLWSLSPLQAERPPAFTWSALFGIGLLLSMISVATGLVLCALWQRRLSVSKRRWPSLDAAYDGSLNLVNWLAVEFTRYFQHGMLNGYMRAIVGGLIVLVWMALIDWGEFLAPLLQGQRLSLLEAALGLAMILGALAAVFSRSRLGAIAALGIVGYGVAVVYVLFGAPDLAMTQIAVETLTLILFVFTFYYLPRKPRTRNTAPRVRDALVSAAFGATVTFLAVAASHMQPAPVLRDYFAANAYPLAHGRNVVNVILVDFRGIDTMGEITVLAVAAMGVFALLKVSDRRRPSDR